MLLEATATVTLPADMSASPLLAPVEVLGVPFDTRTVAVTSSRYVNMQHLLDPRALALLLDSLSPLQLDASCFVALRPVAGLYMSRAACLELAVPWLLDRFPSVALWLRLELGDAPICAVGDAHYAMGLLVASTTEHADRMREMFGAPPNAELRDVLMQRVCALAGTRAFEHVHLATVLTFAHDVLSRLGLEPLSFPSVSP